MKIPHGEGFWQISRDSDGKLTDLLTCGMLNRANPFKPGEPYYLGMFQWSLPGDYGQSAQSVQTPCCPYPVVQRDTKLNTLSKVTRQKFVGYVQYDAEDLVECIAGVPSKLPCKKSRSRFRNLSDLQTYEQSLSRYTYLSA